MDIYEALLRVQILLQAKVSILCIKLPDVADFNERSKMVNEMVLWTQHISKLDSLAKELHMKDFLNAKLV